MTPMKKNLIASCAAFLLPVLTSVTLMAGDGEGGHRRHAPPPAAFDACKGKKANDACEVTFGDRKMPGKCGDTPEGLACRPDRPMGPPPELVNACEGKKDGDACSVTMGDKTRAGTCSQGRGDKLFCRPSK